MSIWNINQERSNACQPSFSWNRKNNYSFTYLILLPYSPRESRFTFDDLDFDERLLIDYYTDELFIPKVASEGIRYAVFPYCRLFCDVERLMNDPLESRGLGFC